MVAREGEGEEVAGTYLDDRVLALDTRGELGLLDVDDEISRLEVTGDAESDVQLGDGLVPLVGKGSLLLGLLCAGSSVLGGGGLCGWCEREFIRRALRREPDEEGS